MHPKLTRLVQVLLVVVLLLSSVTPALGASLQPQVELDASGPGIVAEQGLFQSVQSLSDDDEDDREERKNDDDDKDSEKDDDDDRDERKDDDDDEDDDGPKADIVDTAIAAGQFNTLVAAVQAAGLEDTLRSDGPFTVFAPTDDAFAALPEGALDDLLADIPALTNVLLYHVVADKRLKAERVVEKDSLRMAQGQKTQIEVNDEGVFINDAQIIVTDVLASNGVIHVIDAVLIPPAADDDDDDDEDDDGPKADIVDTAIAAGQFNTLVAAVQAAGLEDTLRSEGPFTVFAPTDDAFAALPDGALDDLLADIPALTNVLLYHVVADKRLKAERVVEKESLRMAQGQKTQIKVDDDEVFINNAKIIVTDVLATNGVIHVIDAVLIPPAADDDDDDDDNGDKEELMDIVDTASKNGFSTLVAAVQAAGLEKKLRRKGPYTVFAPTNAAFEKLPDGVLEELLADRKALRNILLYHVVPRKKLLAEKVIKRKRLRMAQGQKTQITVNDEGVFINDAQITGTDVLASNGVIHVIDTVLIPPSRKKHDDD